MITTMMIKMTMTTTMITIMITTMTMMMTTVMLELVSERSDLWPGVRTNFNTALYSALYTLYNVQCTSYTL